MYKHILHYCYRKCRNKEASSSCIIDPWTKIYTWNCNGKDFTQVLLCSLLNKHIKKSFLWYKSDNFYFYNINHVIICSNQGDFCLKNLEQNVINIDYGTSLLYTLLNREGESKKLWFTENTEGRILAKCKWADCVDDCAALLRNSFSSTFFDIFPYIFFPKSCRNFDITCWNFGLLQDKFRLQGTIDLLLWQIWLQARRRYSLPSKKDI